MATHDKPRKDAPTPLECDGCRRTVLEIHPATLARCHVTHRDLCPDCWAGVDPREYGLAHHATGKVWANQARPS